MEDFLKSCVLSVIVSRTHVNPVIQVIKAIFQSFVFCFHTKWHIALSEWIDIISAQT